jgi:hypothetical protein
MSNSKLKCFNGSNEIFSVDAINGMNVNVQMNSTNANITNMTTNNLIAQNINVQNFTVSSFALSNILTTNITTTNLITTNAIISNVTVSNLLSTNVTTNNLLTTNLNNSNATISNLNSLNATITNLLTTNISSNALIVTGASITNLNSLNATITNLLTTNISSNALIVTGASITNLNSLNTTITSLLTTNISSNTLIVTGASITNLNSLNTTITSLLTTNISSNTLIVTGASITNLNSLNATIASLVLQNVAISNLTTNNILLQTANSELTSTQNNYIQGNTVASISGSNGVYYTPTIILAAPLLAGQMWNFGGAPTHNGSDIVMSGGDIADIANNGTGPVVSRAGNIYIQGGRSYVGGTSGTASTNQAGAIIFKNGITGLSNTDKTLYESMRIIPGGLIGINTSNPSCNLDVNGNLKAINTTISNSIITNVLGTNITTTNAISSFSTMYNVLATNITTSNFIATNAISSFSTMYNLLAVNITSSNLISGNVMSTNITTNNFIATNAISSFSTMYNLLAVNITTSNFIANNILVNANITIGNNAIVSGKLNTSALNVFANSSIGSQGLYLQWNRSVGDGEAYLINQKGGGSGSIRFGISDTNNNVSEQMRIDPSGNLGINTPSPNYKLDVNGIIGSTGISTGALSSTNITTSNITINGNGSILLNTNSQIFSSGSGPTSDLRLASYGGLGITIAGSSGYVGFGTSPNAPIQLSNSVLNRKVVLYDLSNNDHQFYGMGLNTSILRYQVDDPTASHVFYSGLNSSSSKELLRIKGNGSIGINTSSSSYNFDVNGTCLLRDTDFINRTSGTLACSIVPSIPYTNSANGSSAIMYIAYANTTTRSINASGTINASGSDYAEYMIKKDNTISFNKGDIVGVNNQGKLTDKFSESITFLIKSTNPSFVGGDNWSNDIQKPIKPTQSTEIPIKMESTDTPIPETSLIDAEMELYNSLELTYLKQVEEKRGLVDRIAFVGQVPLNINASNTEVGNYIIPLQGPLDIILASSINKNNMTFEMYLLAIGQVINIINESQVNVIVKSI